MGTKYPKPCIVFATMRNQNDLFFNHDQSEDLAAGPCTRDWGNLPFTNGINGTSKDATAMDKMRKVLDGPYTSSTLGRINGSTKPPAAVPEENIRYKHRHTEGLDIPAKMTPFAKPLLFTNHSDIYDMQGA